MVGVPVMYPWVGARAEGVAKGEGEGAGVLWAMRGGPFYVPKGSVYPEGALTGH